MLASLEDRKRVGYERGQARAVSKGFAKAKRTKRHLLSLQSPKFDGANR